MFKWFQEEALLQKDDQRKASWANIVMSHKHLKLYLRFESLIYCLLSCTAQWTCRLLLWCVDVQYWCKYFLKNNWYPHLFWKIKGSFQECFRTQIDCKFELIHSILLVCNIWQRLTKILYMRNFGIGLHISINLCTFAYRSEFEEY